MAANDDEVFMQDIDIDYDKVVSYEELEKYNNPIVIPDDFDQMEDVCVTSVPMIQFVDEVSISQVVESSRNVSVIIETFSCTKCGKRYKKKSYFYKHQLTCGKRLIYYSVSNQEGFSN